MSFTRIHHVGMVTGDLNHARHVLCDGFGLAIDQHRTPWPEGRRRAADGAAVIEVPIGEMYYEVASPADERSPAGQFLTWSNGRGGIHLITIASDDFGADLNGLQRRGIALHSGGTGKEPAILDPATTFGLGIQIVPEDHYYVHPHFRGNGAATGMAHIGIAARSVEETRRLWGELFGLPEDEGSGRRLEPRAEGERRGADDPVQLLEFPLGGSVIEISVPTTTDSGTARMVAQRAPLGAVYHHTCPYTPDVHRFMDQAVAAGLQQIGSIPPKDQATGTVVGWLHPRTSLGMLVEVWNRPPGPKHYHGHPAV